MAQITLNSSGVASSGSLLLQTNGTTTQATVDTSGNLGLGVTPSAWGSGRRVFQMGTTPYIMGSGTSLELLANAYFNGTNWIYNSNGAASYYALNAGAHTWYNAASGTTGNAISFTQAMTLDASGNLGVGTSSPAAIGTNYTTVDVNGASGGAISFRTSGTRYGYIYGNTGGLTLNAEGATNIASYTNGSERMRIDSSGNLLVGTTNAASSSGIGVKLLPTGSVYVVNSNQDGFDFYSTSAGAYRFYVTAGGTIYATSTTISAISDERLKENIRDIDTGINSVMALKPRRFDWKEGKGQNKKDVAGFIAQEFEEVFPECVGTTKAGEDGIEYKNINHETLIPTLVKAIQELKAELDAAKADIATLKG